MTSQDTIQVAHVVDRFTLVLNRGEAHGLREGQRFLIWADGPEINDPATGKLIGNLEVIKGKARVTHLQNDMCTVKSDSAKTTPKIVKRFSSPMRGLFAMERGEEVIEEQPMPQYLPFENPEVGDFARPI